MDTPRSKPTNPAEAIYREVRTARETTQQLLPLLTLLEDEETESPLDEIKALLASILEALHLQSEAIDRLASAYASGIQSEPFPGSMSQR
ncbi:hypothetical protein AB4097_01375 [Microvirga sp. 2MCAF35]|uniref:hypothetical protein n=1 Tax=Microvirga sp. 2MCAF35 TaxID=3232987 RepID=UPI003F9A7A2A